MIGDFDGSLDKSSLQNFEITHILVAGKFLPKNFPEDFEYRTLSLIDSPDQNLFPFIEEAVNFINKGKVVFVHCAAGISRSSSMVIAYLMIEKKMRYDEAYGLVKKKRPIICPNLGFQAQLRKIDEMIVNNEFDYKKLALMEPPIPTLDQKSKFSEENQEDSG